MPQSDVVIGWVDNGRSYFDVSLHIVTLVLYSFVLELELQSAIRFRLREGL